MPFTVSAIVPTLNEAARIDDALRQLLTAPGLSEIIVVDGGSSDDTVAIANAHAGVRVLSSPAGRGVQMNRGAEAATGDVLLFVHADVTLPADACSWIRTALAAPSLVAGAFRTWTVPERPSRWMASALHIADIRSRYSRFPYGDQAVFVRASAFRAVGGFPEIPLMEDLELAIRLRALGRIQTVAACVNVSGRRFEARPLYYGLLMTVFPTLYRLGVPASSLAKLYGTPRGPKR